MNDYNQKDYSSLERKDLQIIFYIFKNSYFFK